MRARGLTLGILVWLCGTVGCLAFGVAVAPAAVIHEYLSQITEVPAVGPHGEAVPVPGPLGGVDSLAGDGGHVWVAEQEQRQGYRVDEFDVSSGAFVTQLPHQSVGFRHGLAVGHATGEAVTYVASSESVFVFGANGSLLGQWTGTDTISKSFGSSCGECRTLNNTIVAVDKSSGLGDWAAGDVYVADTVHNVVDVFEAEAAGEEKLAAELTGISPGEPFSTPRQIAVSAFNGDVLVLDESGLNIFKPAPLGGQYEFVGKLSGPPPSGSFEEIVSFTVDPSNGDIYVAEHQVVDQFSAAGAYLGHMTGLGTPTDSFGSLQSVAVDPLTRRVLVGDYGGGERPSVIDLFGPSLIVPDVTTVAPSGIAARTATLNGTVNPDGQGAATCQFEWGTSTAFGNTAPCTPASLEGESPLPVSAQITKLLPDATYYYRLQATNANGTNPGEASQDQEFTTPGPGIASESTSSVTATSATLDAGIVPHGVATSYYFQYGTSNAYGAEVPAAPGFQIGSGTATVEVSQHLQNLAPGTVYHYRVVTVGELAPDVFEAFEGTDQTFTTQTTGGASALPDGRRWEMVSPQDKHGAQIQAIGQYAGEGPAIQASAAGNAMTYQTDVPTESEPEGYSNGVQLFSARGATGWGSRDIAISHETAAGAPLGQEGEYEFFSEDLSVGALQPFGSFSKSESSEATEATAFLHTDYLNGDVNSWCQNSCFHPLVTGASGHANVPPGTAFGGEIDHKCENVWCGPRFVGASSDFQHVVLNSDVALTSTPVPGTGNLYEWTGGKLELVSVLPAPGGEPVSGVVLGDEIPGPGIQARNAISGDGSRVVWSELGGGAHLYLRDMQLGQTVQLDAVQGGSGEGAFEPIFQVASRDGSKVFFTDTQRLTEDSGGYQGQPDLYECEMVVVGGTLECQLSDVTPVNGGESASVRGNVLGASDDGSYVYFVANGVLPGSGASVQGTCGRPTSGNWCNLFVRHNGVTKLVTVLSEGDERDWSGHLADLTAKVSPDGRWLAFMSQRGLTGYDTRDAVSGQPDQEVYLYDASAGGVVCASCNPTGARPNGLQAGNNDGLTLGDRNWDREWVAANIPGWTQYSGNAALYQSRYLSDSGRLFFNSSDALVPQDVNGTEDVYEFEPPGVGGCTSASVTFSARSGGCVGLISSGGSSEESGFMDASATGGDVFFLTSAKLTGQDSDSAVDVYDAHECTSVSPCFAATRTAPPVCDTGDACKPAPTPQPAIFGTPASATFSGAGNVVLAGSKPVVRARGLTRAQKRARALRACRKKKHGRRRIACERQAKARYAARRASRATAIKRSGQ